MFWNPNISQALLTLHDFLFFSLSQRFMGMYSSCVRRCFLLQNFFSSSFLHLIFNLQDVVVYNYYYPSSPAPLLTLPDPHPNSSPSPLSSLLGWCQPSRRSLKKRHQIFGPNITLFVCFECFLLLSSLLLLVLSHIVT